MVVKLLSFSLSVPPLHILSFLKQSLNNSLSYRHSVLKTCNTHFVLNYFSSYLTGAFLTNMNAKPRKLNDSSVTLNDSIFLELNQSIHSNLEKYYEAPNLLLKRFEAFDDLFSGKQALKVSKAIQDCVGMLSAISESFHLVISPLTHLFYALVLVIFLCF